jgi:hypothetical protein
LKFQCGATLVTILPNDNLASIRQLTAGDGVLHFGSLGDTLGALALDIKPAMVFANIRPGVLLSYS